MLGSRLQKIAVVVAVGFVGLIGFWLTRTPSTAPEPKLVGFSFHQSSPMAEAKKVPAREPLSSRDIKGSLKMPNNCQRPVMEVQFENGGARMGVSCQDGAVTYHETFSVGSVDTSVPAYDARGASFAMALSDQSSVDQNPVGLPPDKDQGVTIEVPIPNTCTHAGADVRFGHGATTIRYSCLDGKVVYDKTIEISLDVVNDPGMNKSMVPIIAMVLRDPAYVTRN